MSKRVPKLPSGFLVQAKPCETCIYRKNLGWNIKALEAQIATEYGDFNGYRVCHHAPNRSKVCCAGFWARHKDKFALGQIAQRLGFVRFVSIDKL